MSEIITIHNTTTQYLQLPLTLHVAYNSEIIIENDIYIERDINYGR